MDEKRISVLFDYLKNGQMKYFDEFYNLLKKMIFYNIFALTKSHEISEDILQDTFVKFLGNIQRIESNESIVGYLMLLSRNLTLDYFKKNNRIREIDDTKDNLSSYDEQKLETSILLDKVQKILKDKEFEIFVLHVLNELTFEEIAKLLKRPVGTVLWSYNNSLKKVRKEFSLYEEN